MASQSVGFMLSSLRLNLIPTLIPTLPYPNRSANTLPDPLNDPKDGTSKMTPIATLAKLGDYWEVPFFGSFP